MTGPKHNLAKVERMPEVGVGIGWTATCICGEKRSSHLKDYALERLAQHVVAGWRADGTLPEDTRP